MWNFTWIFFKLYFICLVNRVKCLFFSAHTSIQATVEKEVCPSSFFQNHQQATVSLSPFSYSRCKKGRIFCVMCWAERRVFFEFFGSPALTPVSPPLGWHEPSQQGKNSDYISLRGGHFVCYGKRRGVKGCFFVTWLRRLVLIGFFPFIFFRRKLRNTFFLFPQIQWFPAPFFTPRLIGSGPTNYGGFQVHFLGPDFFLFFSGGNRLRLGANFDPRNGSLGLVTDEGEGEGEREESDEHIGAQLCWTFWKIGNYKKI